MSDLKQWLEGLGLGAHAETLAENDVDLEVLPDLDDGDLRELGLSLGHRKKLLAAAAKLKAPEANAGAAARPGARRPRGAEAERRQISILFCDLVGSTQLSQQLDPEALHEVMRAYQDAVAGAIARYNGFVAKFLGDGVLAYFGWPQAYEDQAVRAVHAALASIEAVQALEAGTGDGPLQARAGIATGNVVVADIAGEVATDSGAVLGETPNLAARLQAVTKPGEIATDDLTRRLIGSTFEVESLGRHELKGFTKAVEAWRVVRALRGATRFEASHGSQLTGFVGREREIDLLRDRWRLASAGEGQAVVFSGEPGIGKSRILREFEGAVAGEPHAVAQLQCSPYGTNTAFHPFVDYIYSAAGLDAAADDDGKLDALEAFTGWRGADVNEEAALFAALMSLPVERYPPLAMSPLKQKLRSVELLIALFTRMAEARPLALLAEDIHWIDPSSLEVFEALVGEAQDYRMLLVLTHRPEFEPGWSGFGHVTQYSLNRLSKEQGRTIAERMTGGKALPEEVLTQILAQTDGVPLFIEELTKAILEADFLKLEGERYVLAGPLSPVAIPSTLHGSLTARIDRLSSVKEVIQAAACIGREFSAALLGRVLPLNEAMLERALDELIEAELVFRRRAAGGGTSYIFKHALVQDAAYDGLVKTKRQTLHGKIAAALEAEADRDPMVLARHFAAAGKAEHSAGWFFQAGKRSLAASALPEAIAALELGLGELNSLERTPEREGLALQMRLMLGTARMAQFGWANPSVSEALEPAFDLAQALDQRGALGPLFWGLWVHYQTRTEFDAAIAWLDRLDGALENVGGEHERELLAVRDSSRGCQHFWHAEYDKAQAYTDHLRQIYDPEFHARIVAYANHDPLCFALHWAGSLNDWITGYPEKSLRSLEEALEIERRLSHPFNSAFALTAGAQSLPWLGEAERLLQHCDRVEKIAEEEGLGPFAELVLVAQWRGQALIAKGDYEEGYRQQKSGNDFWLEMGGRVCNALFWSWQARGLLGLGRLDEAREVIDQAIDHCRRTRDRWMEPECLRIKADLLLADEERAGLEEAEVLLAEAIALAKRTGARSWQLRAATTLLEAGRRLGGAEPAKAEVASCLSAFSEGHATADLITAQQGLDAS